MNPSLMQDLPEDELSKDPKIFNWFLVCAISYFSFFKSSLKSSQANNLNLFSELES
jgi:hypothetical protein